ncbi:MAG: DUF4405 domain-containing protein [Sedimentisphaerales bacterium]|nr:DUF4405 domain-containing protein [Sedimentisphaerales bacterium]
MSEKAKTKFNWRSYVSVLTALSFIGMTFTGIILFFVPSGRVANWTGWTMLALTKQQWIGLHDWFSIIFVIASIFHLYLNWKPFVSYFKSKVTRVFGLRAEWALATVTCIAVFVCTLAGVKPFSSLISWGESIKQSWDSPRQRAPIPHAELLSLRELAEKVTNVDLETMLSNLKANRIDVGSPDVVLGDLAEACGMTPARLYDIALGQAATGIGGGGRHGQAGAEGGRGGGPGRGLGRITLKQYCEQMDLDLDTSIKKLKDAGFTVSAEMTFRDIADSTGARSSEIINILQAPGH